MNRALITLVLLLHFSCATINQKYEDQYGRVIPKNPKFKLEGKLLNYSGDYLIDTTAIYINKSQDVYAGGRQFDSLFNFIKFFDDGKIFISKSTRTINNDMSVNDGFIGYYTFSNNEILAEIFTNREFGSYVYIKYRVSGDTLIRYKEKIRCTTCMWKSGVSKYIKENKELENLNSNW